MKNEFMLESNQSMNHSRKGEIATTITLITLFTMFIGVIAGQIATNNSRTVRSKAAEGCVYMAKVMVTKAGGPFSETQNGSGQFWGVKNNKGDQHGFDSSPSYSEWYYHPAQEKFLPEPGAHYSKGDLAEIFLLGLNTNQWNVKNIFCYDNGNSHACRSDTALSIGSNGSISIKNIRVDCGVDVTYGWDVESKTKTAPTAAPTSVPPTVVPTASQSCVGLGGRCSPNSFQSCCPDSTCLVNTPPPAKPTLTGSIPFTPIPNGNTNEVSGKCVRSSQPPTPKPTAPTASNCSYTAYAQVKKRTAGGLSLLTIGENASNAGFGVSNNKQLEQFGPNHVAGKFGTIQNISKTSFLGNTAEFDYINPHHPYKDFFPNDSHLYRIGEPASVTLLGLNPRWKIVGKFCDDIGTGPKACDGGVKKQPLNKIITNFRLDCKIAVRYGWIVEDTVPTASPKPTKPIYPTNPVITPRPTNTPNPSISPSLTPTPNPSISPSPTPQPIACNGAATAGGYSEFPDEREWEMGTGTGNVYVSYQMYGIQDKLEVFQDKTDIYHTGPVGGSAEFVAGSLINQPINYITGGSSKIKAVLTSNQTRDDKEGTQWFYSISCPMQPPPIEAVCHDATGRVSGKIEVPDKLKKICDSHNGCTVRVKLTSQNQVLTTEAKSPDFTYIFSNVNNEIATSVTVGVVEDVNGILLSGSYNNLSKNCFEPRRWNDKGGYTFGDICDIDMTRERGCNAENVDFVFVPISQVPFPSKVNRITMDLNKDGVINAIDYTKVARKFGKVAKYTPEDLNHDGFVNAIDISLIIFNLNKQTG